jgi:hypothetical protein
MDADVSPPNLCPVAIPAKALGCSDRTSIVHVAAATNQTDPASRADNSAFIMPHPVPHRKEYREIQRHSGAGVERDVRTVRAVRNELSYMTARF